MHKGSSGKITDALQIPSRLFTDGMRFDHTRNRTLDHRCHDILQRFGFIDDFQTLPINDLTLFTHDFIVFQYVFTGIIVIAFHSFLGGFHLFGKHFALDDHIFRFIIQIQFAPDLLDAFRSEASHQVVFQ